MLEEEQLLPWISPTLTLGSSPGGAQLTVLLCCPTDLTWEFTYAHMNDKGWLLLLCGFFFLFFI